eukprot:4890449-Prymnesium_polylepis.1
MPKLHSCREKRDRGKRGKRHRVKHRARDHRALPCRGAGLGSTLAHLRHKLEDWAVVGRRRLGNLRVGALYLLGRAVAPVVGDVEPRALHVPLDRALERLEDCLVEVKVRIDRAAVVRGGAANPAHVQRAVCLGVPGTTSNFSVRPVWHIGSL